MFGVELREASVVRASKLCELEGEALASEGEEPASAGISASPGRGTKLGVSENTPGFA